LTRHDPKTFGDSGGPITHDMNSPEIYGTVFSLAPGKTDVNIIWAGSDDGIVNLTRDGGKTWTNVTPKDMPEFGRVSQIDASQFDAGTAFVSVKKMLLTDYSPYIFRTHDYGRTWTKIVAGIAPTDFVSSVREDPDSPWPALRRYRARLSTSRWMTATIGARCPTDCRSPRCQISGSKATTSSFRRWGEASTFSTTSIHCGSSMHRHVCGRLVLVQAGRCDSDRGSGPHRLLAEKTTAEHEAGNSR
jgi:hypothetical protein